MSVLGGKRTRCVVQMRPQWEVRLVSLRRRGAMRLCVALIFTASVTLASCSNEPPAQLDRSSIIGCYAAEGGPLITITRTSVAVAGHESVVPYSYEMRTIGPVLSVPLEAVKDPTGGIELRRSEIGAFNYHVRPMATNGPPAFSISTRQGPSLAYVRQHESNCG
jgi:hypothetical protein